jgi:hypothetical protein
LVRYYEEGNLNALVGMFTENARVNEGSGTAFIRDEYAGFFAETAVRRLTVAGLDWRAADGGRLIGTGFFISSAQGNPGGRWRYQRGELRIDLVPSMGSFKISRMTHR